MAKLILKKCELVIRLRVGRLPDGRARHRPVRLGGIRPDADAGRLAAVVLALEPLLGGVITEVRRATEYILETTVTRGEKNAPAITPALPVSAVKKSAPTQFPQSENQAPARRRQRHNRLWRHQARLSRKTAILHQLWTNRIFWMKIAAVTAYLLE
jgi:hypothetical protein